MEEWRGIRLERLLYSILGLGLPVFFSVEAEYFCIPGRRAGESPIVGLFVQCCHFLWIQ